MNDDLFRIEEGFWLNGAEHFRTYLEERCLLAFPQASEMHGVFDREAVAATATPSNRWRDLTMSERQVLDLGETAILSYRAAVSRADGERYRALVSSAYVRRGEGWRLAFHQHSPLA
ncbi:nuclear transport factor 2 family protein [Sphingomonas parva]|uniref:Nuclear transport factor 2 family protein n=1 Tax=Sphingomonas parva TaxID=2555898 RepID=A0A4Y8ZQ86_9SPHN|nr:DUF4440 domain-containing protein [Sphingomonas parva]TFI57442.1 nuclear transport factor 2 family protein [Sphingomonas parva]